jgi:hypothetical protein
MATSSRLKAQNIKFNISSTDYSPDCENIELSLEDMSGDIRTFDEVRTGGMWKLKLAGLYSQTSSSLYQLLWTNYNTQVAFVLAPSGNAVASASQPHWTGTVIFDDLPPISLQAGDVTKFEVTLSVDASVHTPSATPPVFFGLTRKTTA